MDYDHIGWNSSEIISPLVSLGRSLSAGRNIRGLLQGEHPEILAQSDPTPLPVDRITYIVLVQTLNHAQSKTPPPVDLSVGDIRS